MSNNSKQIKNLRNAINTKGHKITYSVSEVFLPNNIFPQPLYTIKKAVYNEKTGRNKYIELFHTFSQIQVVLFLRDYWFKINNWELPTDNEKWNMIRKSLEEQ